MQRLDFLSTVPLFQGLSDRELEALNSATSERRFTTGQVVAGVEEDERSLYLVREGRIKITKTSYAGKQQTLQIYGPGELVGLFSLFNGLPYPAAAVAMEDCRVLVLSRRTLESTARRVPSLMVNLFQALSMRMNECMRTVELLALKETPQRLAACLLMESCGRNGSEAFVLSFSHREWATLLGTTPETLSRTLKRLCCEGLISHQGRVIRILDRRGLVRLYHG